MYTRNQMAEYLRITPFTFSISYRDCEFMKKALVHEKMPANKNNPYSFDKDEVMAEIMKKYNGGHYGRN
jgi:hypothetical protein